MNITSNQIQWFSWKGTTELIKIFEYKIFFGVIGSHVIDGIPCTKKKKKN